MVPEVGIRGSRPCLVVFCDNKWWFSGELWPGFEIHVMQRTEAWLSARLHDREEALQNADGFLRCRMSKSDLDLLMNQYPDPRHFNKMIREKALTVERRVVDEVHTAVKDPVKHYQERNRPGWFAICQDLQEDDK
jgi:hypothetical protein